MDVVLHFLTKPPERLRGEVSGTMAIKSAVLFESTQAMYVDSKNKTIENIEKIQEKHQTKPRTLPLKGQWLFQL